MLKKKTQKKPPERRTLRVKEHLYDVIYVDRKPKYLGKSGSEDPKRQRGRIPTECEDCYVPSISTERFIPTGVRQ